MIKVIGIGSPFGDDRIGWEVIKDLQTQYLATKNSLSSVIFEICDRPGMHLLNLMSGCPCIFLVDAVKTGATVGTIHQLNKDEIKQFTAQFSTHEINLGEIVSIGEILGQLPDKLFFYGVEITTTTLNGSLSPAVITAKNILVKQLHENIKNYL